MKGRNGFAAIGTVVALLASSILVSGCSGGGSRVAASQEPGILLIVVDALRKDKMGAYGYERDVTRAMDELARDPDAVVFHRHYVQGANTKISTSSTFTGLFPFQHGVIWGHEMRESPSRAGSYATQILREELDTMAERLGAAGFYTFGIVKSHHLVPEYGFAQGFTDYFGPKEVGSDRKRSRKTLDLIEDAPGSFFGYLHLVGAHHPFRSKERSRSVMERYGFEYDEKARMEAGVDFTTSAMKNKLNDREVILEPDDIRFLNLVYDAKLEKVDQEYIAPLLDGLKEMGRYDNTLIVLTADHGEELYDHEGYAHGHALWDEVVNVPLVVKFPAGKRPDSLPDQVHVVTQAIDLIPSFLSFFGHPAPEELPGTDIFLGEPRGSAYSETKTGWMLVDSQYKLIMNNGITFLSDHLEDPDESVNLALDRAEQLERMKMAADALRAHVAIQPQEAPVAQTEPDEEAIEALKSLGYLN
jgi:arylsulfatase A-like enzyme